MVSVVWWSSWGNQLSCLLSHRTNLLHTRRAWKILKTRHQTTNRKYKKRKAEINNERATSNGDGACLMDVSMFFVRWITSLLPVLAWKKKSPFGPFWPRPFYILSRKSANDHRSGRCCSFIKENRTDTRLVMCFDLTKEIQRKWRRVKTSHGECVTF